MLPFDCDNVREAFDELPRELSLNTRVLDLELSAEAPLFNERSEGVPLNERTEELPVDELILAGLPLEEPPLIDERTDGRKSLRRLGPSE